MKYMNDVYENVYVYYKDILLAVVVHSAGRYFRIYIDLVIY